MLSEKSQSAAIVSPCRWPVLEAALEDNTDITLLPGLKELRCLAPDTVPDVIFVDVAAYREALSMNGGIPFASSSYVVSIVADCEPAEMRLAMRAGSRDWLTPPFDSEQLEDIFKRARSHRGSVSATSPSGVQEPAPRKSAEIISFFTTKGGAGKSALATNFAAALTRRDPHCRVCLIDLDLQFGDLALILNVKPSATIMDAFEDGRLKDGAASCLCECGERLWLLAAPLRPEEAELIRAEYIEALFELLRPNFDYIVIDTAASFNDFTLAALDGSDKVFLVVTPIILSLKNLKRVLDIMTGSLGYAEAKIKIILNRCDSRSGITDKEIEDICGRGIDFRVPSEGNVVVQSINVGRPAVEYSPKCKFSIALKRMAETMAAPADTNSPAQKARPWLLSLFSPAGSGRK